MCSLQVHACTSRGLLCRSTGATVVWRHCSLQLRTTVPKGLSDEMRKDVWKSFATTYDIMRQYPKLYEVRSTCVWMPSCWFAPSQPTHGLAVPRQLLLGMGRCLDYDGVIVADVSRQVPSLLSLDLVCKLRDDPLLPWVLLTGRCPHIRSLAVASG
jgi:hypothetical protein